jgi:hypothetical protein
VSTPLSELAILLAEAEKADSIQPLGLQTSERLLLLKQFRSATRAMLEFHAGYAENHQTLTELVYRLLGTVSAHSNGRGHWATELPQGTAPEFKRTLNAIIKFLDSP